MKIVLTPFMYAATCGIVLSIIEHASALLGYPSPIGVYSKYLSMGVFVVWIPTVIVANKLSRDLNQKDMLKAVFRGCPSWMKVTVYFFFGYAILNFILCVIIDFTQEAASIGARIGSGHSMAFYSIAMAALYSFIHFKEGDIRRRCLNGHSLSPLARFCEQCGAPASEPQLNPR